MATRWWMKQPISRPGIEPRTQWLEARHATTELGPHPHDVSLIHHTASTNIIQKRCKLSAQRQQDRGFSKLLCIFAGWLQAEWCNPIGCTASRPRFWLVEARGTQATVFLAHFINAYLMPYVLMNLASFKFMLKQIWVVESNCNTNLAVKEHWVIYAVSQFEVFRGDNMICNTKCLIMSQCYWS